MIPRNQADITLKRAIQTSALDCSLPPHLMLYIARPQKPFLEAEASVLIQPGQNSTWITFQVDTLKHYLYLSQRNSKASKDLVPHRPRFLATSSIRLSCWHGTKENGKHRKQNLRILSHLLSSGLNNV